MGAHHTQDKGDLGVAKAHADLVEQGWLVLFPTTEHAPFDLVAYRDGEFRRVQVTDHCYYLDPRSHRVSVTLRITPTRNGQVAGVLPAERFRRMPD